MRMRRIALLAAVLFCVIASGCSTMSMSAKEHRSARLQRYPRPPTQTKLQAGDRIQIQMQTTKLMPEVLGEIIDERGYVKLPHVGLVKIGGLIPSAAERVIEDEYVDGKYYKREGIQIAIVPPASEFFVQGCVQRPGSYKFTRRLTVMNAIALAGGPTDYAHKRERIIIRGGQVITINIERIRNGEEADIAIQPGDRIEVPHSPW